MRATSSSCSVLLAAEAPTQARTHVEECRPPIERQAHIDKEPSSAQTTKILTAAHSTAIRCAPTLCTVTPFSSTRVDFSIFVSTSNVRLADKNNGAIFSSKKDYNSMSCMLPLENFFYIAVVVKWLWCSESPRSSVPASSVPRHCDHRPRHTRTDWRHSLTHYQNIAAPTHPKIPLTRVHTHRIILLLTAGGPQMSDNTF